MVIVEPTFRDRSFVAIAVFDVQSCPVFESRTQQEQAHFPRRSRGRRDLLQFVISVGQELALSLLEKCSISIFSIDTLGKMESDLRVQIVDGTTKQRVNCQQRPYR